MKPPGYREGSGQERCGTCGSWRVIPDEHSAKGHCAMFDVDVQKGMTCDKWWSRRIRIKKGAA